MSMKIDRVEPRGNGVFRFTSPHGWALAESAPRITVDGCPQQALAAANRARGLRIDADTGVTRWDGVPMDESMAVEGVLEARKKEPDHAIPRNRRTSEGGSGYACREGQDSHGLNRG